MALLGIHMSASRTLSGAMMLSRVQCPSLRGAMGGGGHSGDGDGDNGRGSGDDAMTVCVVTKQGCVRSMTLVPTQLLVHCAVCLHLGSAAGGIGAGRKHHRAH
jgi:hypothetical protein